MKIRYGTLDDAGMLAELGAKTFYDSFAKDNTPENIALYLEKSFSPEIQLAELSTPETIFLIAEIDGKSIGYAQLIMDSKDAAIKGMEPLEIRRIYAEPEYIGKGVGKELIQASIKDGKTERLRQHLAGCVGEERQSHRVLQKVELRRSRHARLHARRRPAKGFHHGVEA